MKTDALTNPTVRAAIEALQKGDQKAWSALFERDAELYDDGSPRNLEEFTRDALGHERSA
jgi:ketosteroid isomerase-like protein